MPTFTLAISEIAFAEFSNVRASLERNPVLGWKITNSRQVHYMAHLWQLMAAALEEGRKMKNAEQCALFYERSILEALTWTPPHVSRGPYKKATYATIEERAYVAAKIKEKLGIDPTEALISEAINAGEAGFLKDLVRSELDKLKESVQIKPGDTLPVAPEAVTNTELVKNVDGQLPQATDSGLGVDTGSSVEPESTNTPEPT